MPERVTSGLAGLTECCAILGVSKQRVRVLRQQYPDFPQPQQLAQGPVWFRHHLVDWNRERMARNALR